MNDSIAAMRQALDAASLRQLPVGELVPLFRSHATLLEGLPERFGQVLESVLMADWLDQVEARGVA
jgi:hypothetical protein